MKGLLKIEILIIYTFLALQPKSGPVRLFLRFLEHTIRNTHTLTQTHTTNRTPLYWRSARRRPYLHNTQKTQGTNFHALSGIRNWDQIIERPQTYALECTATGTLLGCLMKLLCLQRNSELSGKSMMISARGAR